MSLNGVMAVILRYFTEFGSFRVAVHRSGWRYRRKKLTFTISSPDEFLVNVQLMRWASICTCVDSSKREFVCCIGHYANQ